MRFWDDASKSWARWSDIDPYFAVLSNDDRFRRENLTKGRLEEFFASGSATIDAVLDRCRLEGLDPPRGRALDFGCGAGRLLLPLADLFEVADGVDVAEPMRTLATKNASERGFDNVEVYEAIEAAQHDYDFIHSVLVLQHVPVSVGLGIIDQCIARLTPNGVAALQVPIADRRGSLVRSLGIARRLAPVNAMVNIARGRAASEPLMRMYVYDLNEIVDRLRAAGATRTALWASDHPKFPYCYVIASKRPTEGRKISGIQETE